MSEHVDTESSKALSVAGPDSRHFERLCMERNELIRKLKDLWDAPTVELARLADLPWESVYDILDGHGDPR